ncbi:GNAT family N-acetyltransferase [Ferrimonas marina]|uniref:Acetyltransferase (GNAT) family protein n=1 Tax=Ferrimonas marina TaxID=299255 RepID=A0A1M5Z4B0_9GAMM|nr:GNAT family N-acetyltransferase [Ferrimonas marina]SHI19049.1 Acetyltransferase (GNAT) family protein [Ferrimonas marina]
MVIRQASLQDINKLRQVFLSCESNDELDMSRLVRFIASQGRTFVAQVDGEVTAFVAVNKVSPGIHALYVEPQSQGQGLGRALMETAQTYLQQLGVKRATLHCAVNRPAQHFYRALGWQCRRGDGLWSRRLPAAQGGTRVPDAQWTSRLADADTGSDRATDDCLPAKTRWYLE